MELTVSEQNEQLTNEGGQHSTVVAFALRTQSSLGSNLTAGKPNQEEKMPFQRTCRPKIVRKKQKA